MRNFLIGAALLLVSACGDDGQDAPRLVGIRVYVGEPILRVSKSTGAHATGVDQFSNPFPIGKITWSTNNPAVVVNDSGRITAVALVPEQIVIRADADGKYGTAAMFTHPAPQISALDLSQSPYSVVVGETLQSLVSATDQSGDSIDPGVITWTVRRTSAGDASIDASGRITGIAPGEIVVRASAGNVQLEKPMLVQAR